MSKQVEAVQSVDKLPQRVWIPSWAKADSGDLTTAILREDYADFRRKRGEVMVPYVPEAVAEELAAALRKIRDEAGLTGGAPCGCENHDSPDCCINARYYCPECIAGAALSTYEKTKAGGQ